VECKKNFVTFFKMLIDDGEFEKWLFSSTPNYYAKKLNCTKRKLRWKRLQFVNSVFRSAVPNPIDLKCFCDKTKAKYYNKQPQMALLKRGGLKLIIFKSGKFRVMGPIKTLCEADRFAKRFLSGFPPLIWQTSTVVLNLHRSINLADL